MISETLRYETWNWVWDSSGNTINAVTMSHGYCYQFTPNQVEKALVSRRGTDWNRDAIVMSVLLLPVVFQKCKVIWDSQKSVQPDRHVYQDTMPVAGSNSVIEKCAWTWFRKTKKNRASQTTEWDIHNWKLRQYHGTHIRNIPQYRGCGKKNTIRPLLLPL